MKLSAKTIIMGLAALAIAAAGVYGLTQTFGPDEASVAVSKPADKNGLSSHSKKADEGSVRPVKMTTKGPSTLGMGF